MSYTTNILSKNLTPAAAYREIHQAMWTRYFPGPETSYQDTRRKMETLSTGERGFLLTNEFFGEIQCNGFDGYFSNTDCKEAYRTEQALRLFGLNQATDFLRRALAIAKVPDPLPADYFYEYTEENANALQQLGSEYWKSKAGHDFEEAVVNYVRQHPEQFV